MHRFVAYFPGNPKLEHLLFDINLLVALPRSLSPIVTRKCSRALHLQAITIGFRECFEDLICLWDGFNQTIFLYHFLDTLQSSVTALNRVHKYV